MDEAQAEGRFTSEEKEWIYEAFRQGRLDEERATIELLRIDLFGPRTPRAPDQFGTRAPRRG